ncbi:AAA family ATPase [Pelagibacterium sp.]|uniref:AAA family ATPase n=1 Tax=Pelagibacterium sp. TaxID=1967288 RepID=UPI003A95025C
MKDDDKAARAAAANARTIFELHRRREEIVAGDLPTSEEVLIHATFLRDSIAHDRRVFLEGFLLESDVDSDVNDPALGAAIRHAVDDGSLAALQTARDAMDKLAMPISVRRLDIYLACIDDDAAAHRLLDYNWHHYRDGAFGRMLRSATIHGLIHRALGGDVSLEAAQDFGIADLKRLGEIAADYDAACEAFESGEGREDSKIDLFKKLIVERGEGDVLDLLADVDEDRAEVERQPKKAPPTHLVVPALPKVVSGARKEIRKEFSEVEGVPLPLVTRGDPWRHATILTGRWPHAQHVIEAILGDLAAQEPVRIRPTILVGDPGSGKSSLARAIAEQIGLPVELYSLAGVHDASGMGTSSQWASARASAPLQLIGRSKTANPCVIWDEIEKVGTSRNNGSMLDALLPMLEPSQSRCIRDLALEVEVDLSMVSHIATANSLDEVPAPLKDRMRVIQMPNPEWKHIGPLSRQILDDIAKERGVDPRWHQPLAQDEMEVIRSAWNGGSLRVLRGAIRGTLDARDLVMGRA